MESEDDIFDAGVYSDDDLSFKNDDDDDDDDMDFESSLKGSGLGGKSSSRALKSKVAPKSTNSNTGKKASTKKAAAPKKAPPPKKTTGKKKESVLEREDESEPDDTTDEESDKENAAPSKSVGANKKTIEQIYQKKTQLEHILLRPDTYIGSVEQITQPMFVWSEETEKIVQRDIAFTPGLYKIYDEILVNAADNKQRDPNMDKLDISIDSESNTISVKNNGRGIPVAMHKEHNCYVPTLIFGHLLTGSNFDDNEKKTTGGRNGYGAKLANIFSTEFVIECVDSTNGKKFRQVFRNNMNTAEDPVVTSITNAEMKKGDSTKISFCPDLKRFKMESLDEDTVGLLSKRAYDIAGSMASRSGKKLTVTLNGKKLPVKNFQSYLALYEGIKPPQAYEKVNDRWEVGIGESADASFQQISFVNSICTIKGGTHTTYIADQVAPKLVAAVKKKNKGGTEVKPNQIKNQLCVFVNCLIENPAFDSQTKENLTTRAKDFGSDCKLSEKFMKTLEKSSVVDSILAYVRFKQGQDLQKKGGTKKTKLTGISKLDDANFAGTAKSKDCTLIITEGDSAKSLAMSGLSVVGRDYYGVFPLKGKPLNVREASHTQILKNEEIKNLVDILGLKYGTTYDENNIKTLRYGHLMIMADQDHDGSHIKGLVINFIHHFWGSLLDVPGFLQQFITPIVKATKGKKSLTFFSLPEYESWKQSTGNEGKGYSIKYYKGLGTSTSAEAKEYFSNLDTHEVHFSLLSTDVWGRERLASDEEGSDLESDSEQPVPDGITSGGKLIEMAFSKKQVEQRKVWLNKLAKDTYLNYAEAIKNTIKYSDFINKELILFSQADNQRSIPHLLDGFKPSQRKILFSCFKRKLKGEIKVAQLAGYVSEHSAYHHGEASLNGAIITMAQSFCGSNNVNLLTPSGQFGTRRMGGKDAASPRYIFTKLEKVTRTIFHPDDDALLDYLNDDGLSIEPEFYMPVIPMALVNGSDGIGTGWSSSVPNYDPREIIANLRRMIDGDEPEKMAPHYYGFTGEIEKEQERAKSYVVKGRIERIDDTTLMITELPIKKWTQDYKQFLEGMLQSDTKGAEPELKDFKENHTDTTVSFTITTSKEKIDEFSNSKNGLMGKFKLTTNISTANMNLFNQEGRIFKYETPEDILKDFFAVRLDYYSRRKDLLLKNLRREQLMLSNKARFVEEVCKGDLIVNNRKKADLLEDLKERGYDLMDNSNKKEEKDGDNSDEENELDADDLSRGFDYLLGMKIWTLTFEKVEQLRKQLEEKTHAVANLEATAPTAIWEADLTAIEEALDERDDSMQAAQEEERKAQEKNKKRQGKGVKKNAKSAKKRAVKSKAKDMWDSDLEESDDEDEHDSDDSEAPVAKKRAPSKKKTAAPPKAAPKKQLSSSSSSTAGNISEYEEDELLEGMEKKLHVSPVRKKGSSRLSVVLEADHSSASSSSSAGRKRPSPREADEESEANKSEPAPASKRGKRAETKASTRRGKSKVVESDDEDVEDDLSVEVAPAPAKPSRARGGRSRKQINYRLNDSESENDSE